MSLHSFIYSNNPRYRFLRHTLFWTIWIIYLIVIGMMRSGAKMIGFFPFLEYTAIEILIATAVDMLFCYSVLYMLLPRFLFQEKYIGFFLGLCLFLLLDAALSSYFYTWLINPIRVSWYHLPELKYVAVTDLLRSLHSIMMMGSLAMAIRFYKMWNTKKNELYLAKSEKMSKELKFVDTYIQPSFLPIMLRKIYAFSFSTANRVPEMIEKLQNIMSYLIDECNRPSVPLSREIDSIKDFIQLERLTTATGLTIEFEQQGDPGNLRIVPYLLFPLVENNFHQVNDNINDKNWANISIQIDGTKVKLGLRNSKPVETSNLFNYETVNLQQMRKRLDLLYPGSYKLNIIIEENTFIIQLEIDLSKMVS
jgi:LytS/YehU family sensor histidine kinase